MGGKGSHERVKADLVGNTYSKLTQGSLQEGAKAGHEQVQYSYLGKFAKGREY